jgi:putative N6-adenine-specific DNA methylase
VLRLASGVVSGRDDLYRLAASIAWEQLVGPGRTIAVEAVGRPTVFANRAFAALVVKDAVVDRLRRHTGARPDVDRRTPDVGIHLHLAGATASVGLDASGEPLSHRGYRPGGGPAPLAEALAAGILRLAGYDGEQPLADPMCGSGTLAVEAALIATRTAPGLGRHFAFEGWPGVDPGPLIAARERALAARRPAPAPILASDADLRAVHATHRHALSAGVADAVRVERRDVRELDLPPGWLVVANPPYGKRLGEVEALRSAYSEIGDALKRGAAGCTAWLLVGEPELARSIGLKTSRRVVLFNGPIECRLLRFDLYRGSSRPLPEDRS